MNTFTRRILKISSQSHLNQSLRKKLGTLSIIKQCGPLTWLLARFQSKYHNQVADEFSSGKKPHLTMGEAEASLNPPEQFLRKHTGTGGDHIRAKSAKTHRE